jgi:hypothetical protein
MTHGGRRPGAGRLRGGRNQTTVAKAAVEAEYRAFSVASGADLALLGLVRRYGSVRVSDLYAVARDADMRDLRRRTPMPEGRHRAAATPLARGIPCALFRPPTQYALPRRHPRVGGRVE